MAIALTVEMCCGGHCCVNRNTAKKFAPVADLLIGAALVTIGLLAMFKIIPCTTLTAGAVLGFGVCYLGLIIYRIIVDCKQHSSYGHNYLC